MKFIFFAIFTFYSSFSLACKCAIDFERNWSSAHTIVYAEVTSTRLKNIEFKGSKNKFVEANIVPLEVFKSSSADASFVSDLTYASGNCSITLMSGSTYLFFIRKSGMHLKLPNYIGLCTGSRRIRHPASEEELFIKLRAKSSDS